MRFARTVTDTWESTYYADFYNMSLNNFSNVVIKLLAVVISIIFSLLSFERFSRNVYVENISIEYDTISLSA